MLFLFYSTDNWIEQREIALFGSYIFFRFLNSLTLDFLEFLYFMNVEDFENKT